MKNKDKLVDKSLVDKSPKIKICGLKREEDITIVNKYKPDFVGFVFAESPRKIDFDIASNLKSKLDKDIKVVGVFVNSDIDDIIDLLENDIIDIVQLHGDEDKNYINELKNFNKDITIIKAVEIKYKYDIEHMKNFNVDYILLDSGKGSGKTFNWGLIEDIEKPFFIAGGISNENINDACELEPFAIDLSSSVETDGFKDPEKIKLIMEKLENFKKN